MMREFQPLWSESGTSGSACFPKKKVNCHPKNVQSGSFPNRNDFSGVSIEFSFSVSRSSRDTSCALFSVMCWKLDIEVWIWWIDKLHHLLTLGDDLNIDLCYVHVWCLKLSFEFSLIWELYVFFLLEWRDHFPDLDHLIFLYLLFWLLWCHHISSDTERQYEKYCKNCWEFIKNPCFGKYERLHLLKLIRWKFYCVLISKSKINKYFISSMRNNNSDWSFVYTVWFERYIYWVSQCELCLRFHITKIRK